jgi:hypothetical protein
MRNVSGRTVEKIKTHILYSITFFHRKSCRLWDNVKNMVQPDGSQMTIRRMYFACWITKATGRHSECVTQRLLVLHGSSSYANERQCYVCTHIACLCLSPHRLFMKPAMLSCNKEAKIQITHIDTCKEIQLQVMMMWQDINNALTRSFLPGLKRLEKAVVLEVNLRNLEVRTTDKWCIAKKVTVQPAH